MSRGRRKLSFTREELLARMQETKDPYFVATAAKLATSPFWKVEDVLALVATTLGMTYDQAYDMLEGPPKA